MYLFCFKLSPPLLNNIRKRLAGIEELDDWTPQEQFLGIIGTGREYAIASRYNISIFFHMNLILILVVH